MFSFGIGDYFYPPIAFNFALFVTANFLGMEPINSSSFLLLVSLNIFTLISLHYTYLSKQKANQLCMDKELHGIPLFPFLTLAICFFLSLLVFFQQTDETVASFVFFADILAYFFYSIACFHNFKKLSNYNRCAVCGRVLYSNHDYCDRCGEPLSKKAQRERRKTKDQKESPISEMNFKGICPKCKANLLIGSRFCPKCGSYLDV